MSTEVFLPIDNMYSDGEIFNFSNGTSLLSREPINYIITPQDRVHVWIQGDLLPNVAYRYYDNPAFWYIIADVNDIQNPFEIEVGTELIIPDLELALENS